MGLDSVILVFWMLSFKPAFSPPLSPSSRGSLVPLWFLLLKWLYCCSSCLWHQLSHCICFPGGSDGKVPACNMEDLGSIPGLGRSPGEEKGYALQYSGLENSMDCMVHWVTKSQTQLSNFHFTFKGWSGSAYKAAYKVNLKRIKLSPSNLIAYQNKAKNI